MNRIIHIVILCLWGFVVGIRAQTSLQELIDKMSDSDRKEYFDNARNYIENTYYNQLFATLSNRDAYAYVVEDLMAERDVQCKPEILCKGDEQRYLTPMEYMYCLGREFRDLNTDELEFEVSNIDFSPDILPYSTLSLRVWADYDLEVRYQNRTLLKRRCRMYCLFPRYHVVTRVRLLQVEPLKDLVAPQPVSVVAVSSYEARYNKALHWYEQKRKDKYLPVFRELAEKGYTEAEWKYGHCLHDEKKFSEAVYWYRRAVKKNHAKAQNSLGYCYNYGEGVEKDLKQAVTWYRKSAEQGNAWAQCNLGNCYLDGEGVPKDSKQAVIWYKKAAEQDFAASQCNLGICYYTGVGVQMDSEKAEEWWYKAAVQGYANAQYLLGWVEPDVSKAVVWFTKAAEQGYAEAQNILGVYYEEGEGVVKDLEKAKEWYAKAATKGHENAIKALKRLKKYEQAVSDYSKGLYSLAFPIFKELAEQGDSDAQNYTGVCYEYGLGVSEDKTKAVEWYTKATEQGHKAGKEALDRLKYQQAESDYKKKFYRKAYPVFKELAENGNRQAQYYLGNYYYWGYGEIVQNYELAVQWWEKSAEQGLCDAQYNLGVCYDIGRGVSKDVGKAVEWYLKAAKLGFIDAQYILGRYYRTGKDAKYWFSKAAKQGHKDAQDELYSQAVKDYQNKYYSLAFPMFMELAELDHAYALHALGICYEYGNGVTKNTVRAVECYRKAALKGNISGQYSLGLCYKYGIGVQKNMTKANEWLQKAAEQGDTDAKNELEN